MSEWGKPCIKCGHPSTYHGMTFCSVPVGDGPESARRKCDCDGYSPPVPFPVVQEGHSNE